MLFLLWCFLSLPCVPGFSHVACVFAPHSLSWVFSDGARSFFAFSPLRHLPPLTLLLGVRRFFLILPLLPFVLLVRGILPLCSFFFFACCFSLFITCSCCLFFFFCLPFLFSEVGPLLLCHCFGFGPIVPPSSLVSYVSRFSFSVVPSFRSLHRSSLFLSSSFWVPFFFSWE